MRAAEARHGLQPGLLSIIAINESGAGAQACGFNAWGYASCGVTFDSYAEAIERVAVTLQSYGADTPTMLCIWVSGHGCTNEHAIHYRDTALALLR